MGKTHGEWDIHEIYMRRFMDIFMEHQWNMNEIVLGYLLVLQYPPVNIQKAMEIQFGTHLEMMVFR